MVRKYNNTDDLSVYGVTCDDENGYVLTNNKVFGESDKALSWNDFSNLAGTTCESNASYEQNIGILMKNLGELFDCYTDEASLLRQDGQIGSTPISEFITQKALYFVNFE